MTAQLRIQVLAKYRGLFPNNPVVNGVIDLLDSQNGVSWASADGLVFKIDDYDKLIKRVNERESARVPPGSIAAVVYTKENIKTTLDDYCNKMFDIAGKPYLGIRKGGYKFNKNIQQLR